MASTFKATEEQINLFRNKIKEYQHIQAPLMAILYEAQTIFGCIPLEIQTIISEETGESVAKINGIVTFFSYFSLDPQGKYIISICHGTACHIKGANKIVQKLEEMLNIKLGETTEDGMFTLQKSGCVGTCGLAPVMTVNKELYAPASAKVISDLFTKIMEGS